MNNLRALCDIVWRDLHHLLIVSLRLLDGRDMRAGRDRVAVVVIVPFFGLRGPTWPSALMEVMGDGVLMSEKSGPPRCNRNATV
jgi:hypothetical protein